MTRRDELREMEAAFLREIAQHPDDETAVLIYADWLCDQAEPASVTRGEFLRLQSLLTRGKPGAQRADLEWQARQLWWDHIEEWLGPLYHAVDHFRYERALLSVEVSAESLRQVGEAELLATPAWDWVRHVAVRRGGVETLALLSELPLPEFLTSLDVGRRCITDAAEDLPALLDLPLLGALRELDLSENYFPEEGCARLAAWPQAASLTRLALRRAGIGCDGLVALLASPYLGGLRELDLSYNAIQDFGAEELCRADSVPGLRKLDLRYNAFGWHSVAALQKRFGDGVDVYPSRLQGRSW